MPSPNPAGIEEIPGIRSDLSHSVSFSYDPRDVGSHERDAFVTETRQDVTPIRQDVTLSSRAVAEDRSALVPVATMEDILAHEFAASKGREATQKMVDDDALAIVYRKIHNVAGSPSGPTTSSHATNSKSSADGFLVSGRAMRRSRPSARIASRSAVSA